MTLRGLLCGFNHGCFNASNGPWNHSFSWSLTLSPFTNEAWNEWIFPLLGSNTAWSLFLQYLVPQVIKSNVSFVAEALFNGRVIYIFKILWSSLFRRSMNETNNPTQKCALAGFQYSEWRCPHFAWSVDRINVAVTGLSPQRQRVLRFSQSYIWKMWCMIALLISAFWKPRRQGVRTGWGRQCLAVPHRLTRDDTKWCILQTVFVPHLPHDLPTWSFCSDLTRILTISIGIRFLRIPDSFRIIQIVFRNETKARKWKTHPPQGPRCPS